MKRDSVSEDSEDIGNGVAETGHAMREDFVVCANLRAFLRGIFLMAFLACSGTAFGLSPPLVTDDPETPGAGGWEINITSSIDSSRDETSIEAPLFDINYGFRRE